MGGTDDPDNLVCLTPEEHFVAHQLLCKMHPSHRGLAIAAMFITSHGINRNKQYGWIRRRISLTMKGDNHHFKQNREAWLANQLYMRSDRNPQKKNPRSGERHHFFGKKNPFEWTEESRKKVSESKHGDKNPMFQMPPWKNPTCKGHALEIWSRAEEVLTLHLSNPNWGYSRISKAMNLDAPHRASGVLVKLKSGWRPLEDSSWTSTFKSPK